MSNRKNSNRVNDVFHGHRGCFDPQLVLKFDSRQSDIELAMAEDVFFQAKA